MIRKHIKKDNDNYIQGMTPKQELLKVIISKMNLEGYKAKYIFDYLHTRYLVINSYAFLIIFYTNVWVLISK